eukprot:601778-Hanusia_phi.AAC.1
MGFPAVNRWGYLADVDAGLSLDFRDGEVATRLTSPSLTFLQGLAHLPDALSSGRPYCKAMHVSRSLSVACDVISNRLPRQSTAALKLRLLPQALRGDSRAARARVRHLLPMASVSPHSWRLLHY